MEDTLVSQIKKCMEDKISGGGIEDKEFIIFPFGDVGLQVKYVLNNVYGIQEAYVLDNKLSKYNTNIKTTDFLKNIECENYYLILACTNREIYGALKKNIIKYFPNENILELSSMRHITLIGKHSYGPICRDHQFIESIGSFCSFAIGTEVVFNHEMQYITTHPMIYEGANWGEFVDYSCFKNSPWYIEGIQPKREYLKQAKRIKIGNDVWLGHNVIITNYANIGNGVIAGAGSVITRDVPDYAVVAGVPARIVRYRYLPEEIECMNKIAWWDWSDKEIRERYDDFYLPINEFIIKYI